MLGRSSFVSKILRHERRGRNQVIGRVFMLERQTKQDLKLQQGLNTREKTTVALPSGTDRSRRQVCLTSSETRKWRL